MIIYKCGSCHATDEESDLDQNLHGYHECNNCIDGVMRVMLAPTMKIEVSETKKIVITGVKSLDPVSVYLEDIAPGQGKVIIECFSKSWAYCWGAMGNETIAQFLITAGDDYLFGKFDNDDNRTTYDYDTFPDVIRKETITQRKDDMLSRSDARTLFDIAEDLDCKEACYQVQDILAKIWGDSDHWTFYVPTVESVAYTYFCRIMAAVREALTLYLKDNDEKQS